MATDLPGKGVHWVTDCRASVPVQVSPSGVGALPPITIVQMFQDTAQKHAHRLAMAVQRDGKWIKWNWSQYYRDACRAAKALIHLGLQQFQATAIIGFNSPEWALMGSGTILAGGCPTGIYTTNGPDACHYVASHCEAVVVLVEDREQLGKFLAIKDRLPKLRKIVMYADAVPDNAPPFVMSWDDFIRLGDNPLLEEQLQKRIAAIRPEHCCGFIYTSGTTGPPKGVMISHDNITWTARSMLTLLDMSHNDRVVSYLPLSHVAAQATDLFGPIFCGASVWFAKPDALQGTLVDTLQEARPTVMFAVPRVWEKIEEKMRAIGAQNTGIKKAIGDWAKGIGTRGNQARLRGESLPWGWTLASTLVFRNVKSALGLDQCRLAISAAAPISTSTLEYFLSLDIPIYEVFGMSECSGPQTTNIPGRVKVGSTGFAIPGTEMKIDQPAADGTGEIIFRGRNRFMGYLKNDSATAQTIDSNGFLHSGDVGRIDEDGFLYITGRIKELIITAGGENVAPVLIEDVLKRELPIVSNAMVIGDKRRFLSCCFTLRVKQNPDMSFTDELTDEATQLLSSIGSSAKNLSEARQCPKLAEYIQAGVERANRQAISRAQEVRKWLILPNEFSIETGELTPTMKLKRKVTEQKFAQLIEPLYANQPIPAKL